MMRRFAQLFSGGYSAVPEWEDQAEPQHPSRDARGGSAGRSERPERPQRAEPSARSARTDRSDRTAGASAPAAEDHPELASPLAFSHLARDSLGRALAWGPFHSKDAKRLLEDLCDVVDAGLDPHVKHVEWRRYAAYHADLIKEMDAAWQSLPGLRERHAEQFDATLAQPLDGPLDHYLQMQVAVAEANFQRAREAFFNRRFPSAQALDAQGLKYCERARDLLLCHRHGTAQEQLAMMAVLDAVRAKREPPEAEEALVEAAAWRSRGSLPPWPPSADAASGPKAATTPAASATSASSAASATFGAPATPTTSEVPGVSTQASVPAPDFWARLSEASVILRTEGARIDPGRHIENVLMLLVRESEEAAKSARPEYKALLNDLHHQIGVARLACDELDESRRAHTALAQLLQQHPQWRQPMAATLAAITRGVEDAGLSLQQGAPEEARAMAERTGQKARQAAGRVLMAEAGRWPDAKAQLTRRDQAAEHYTRLLGGRASPASERLLKRAARMLQAFDVAGSGKDAERLLVGMNEALQRVDLIMRRAGDKRTSFLPTQKAPAHT
ncbi:hypothetical protein [Roseateles terrae]|uniref:Uncharacterized protein n=1 Tax=Roseateles terrae TaxID=431060 RepID=A0ABR6GKV3_9BURK|nr:hypothetical protein [Roseateles terrae]MBB3192731.1 hypothetical protein [Roseateles terrae]OWQ89988.1 hypothetical protein CDN98_05760 [Roseateles terrae]